MDSCCFFRFFVWTTTNSKSFLHQPTAQCPCRSSSTLVSSVIYSPPFPLRCWIFFNRVLTSSLHKTAFPVNYANYGHGWWWLATVPGSVWSISPALLLARTGQNITQTWTFGSKLSKCLTGARVNPLDCKLHRHFNPTLVHLGTVTL